MQYRKFGKTRIEVSALGFGMMRLPLLDTGKVNEEESIRMLRYAIDEGLNYVDTAYNYHDGSSEKVTGRALLDGYRDRVYVATKAPTWLYKTGEDFERILDEQLERLQTDYIDFYLLHAMGNRYWESKVMHFNVLERMDAAKKAGKIRHIGFSFHDNFSLFKEIIDYYPWDFCQIQLNYLDTEFQAGIKGLKYAAERGIAVVIMEPLRGGKLANVPDAVKEIFASTGKSPVEWALDFLWDMPEVSLLLSGMNTMEQVKENLAYAKRSHIGMLSAEDKAVIKAVQEQFARYNAIPCTGCSYCLPCPQGVAIPYNFTVYNEYNVSKDLDKSIERYHKWVPRFGEKASACEGCGACEQICPQQIEISKWLAKINELFK